MTKEPQLSLNLIWVEYFLHGHTCNVLHFKLIETSFSTLERKAKRRKGLGSPLEAWHSLGWLYPVKHAWCIYAPLEATEYDVLLIIPSDSTYGFSGKRLLTQSFRSGLQRTNCLETRGWVAPADLSAHSSFIPKMEASTVPRTSVRVEVAGTNGVWNITASWNTISCAIH